LSGVKCGRPSWYCVVGADSGSRQDEGTRRGGRHAHILNPRCHKALARCHPILVMEKIRDNLEEGKPGLAHDFRHEGVLGTKVLWG